MAYSFSLVEVHSCACFITSLDVIIQREAFVVRPGFRKHIDDAIRPGKSLAYDVIEELYWNIDTTIRNTVVERRWSGQALQAAL